MAEAAFLDQKRVRPGSAAFVIAMHGAALAALLLAKHEIETRAPDRTRVDFIEERKDPPPPPPPEPVRDLPRPQDPLVFTAPPTPLPRPGPGPVADDPPIEPTQIDSTHGEEEIRTPPREPERRPVADPPPVRVEAQLDTRSQLQPPYPASEQRLQREGRVVLRVTIGANGRVVSASRVSATSDAFYRVTESHALARWRFRPATLGGRPVESQKTMTVQFRLEG
jgi:protein TonB